MSFCSDFLISRNLSCTPLARADHLYLTVGQGIGGEVHARVVRGGRKLSLPGAIVALHFHALPDKLPAKDVV